ncbi:GNAT family N-acetyltransferase [Nocardioides rubriscoriae]|uniref:GNAT family N-acetyltransferase n=1 Tax=Nocardioides rubriscoriae TaxID=642762 RepID=UPI0011DFBDD7|nr:GNAT family N-acetyltransferase [Nocardioides rubriscoriae]
MTRRIVRLTPDRLADLGHAGVPCRACVRWELDPVRRGRLVTDAEAAAEKDAWLSRVLRDWGSCGRVAVVDDVAVGYVAYAPPAFVPGAASHPTAPVSADAVLMTMAYVAPAHAGAGIGRMLVQSMAADLVTRGGIRAVEAFGDTRGRTDHPGRCVVASDFLAHVGFRTHRPHATTPRMRMELRSALTWKDEVEAALERLVGAVRPAPAPVPHLRQTQQTPDT